MAGLLIPSYPDPRDPENPLANAYGFNARVSFTVTDRSGSAELHVHPSARAAELAPGEYVGPPLTITFGQVITPADPATGAAEVRVSTSDEFWSPPEMQAAYQAITAALLREWQKLPALSRSTVVP